MQFVKGFIQRDCGLLKANSLHINALELRAALFAVRAFTAKKTNLHVHLRMDNRTAITCILKMGGTQSPILLQIAQELWDYALHNQISITAEYLPGGIQSQSRLGVSTSSRFERLEVEPPSVSSTEHPVGPLGSGFICQPNKHPIGVFCELVPRSVCQSNRCLPDPLVRSERLLLSTVLSDLPVLGKDQEGQGNPCDDHSSLVNTSLVSSFTGNVLQTTHIITSSSGLANITQTAKHILLCNKAVCS